MKFMSCNLCLEYKMLEWGIRYFADAIIVTCLFFFHSSVPVFETLRSCGVLGITVSICHT